MTISEQLKHYLETTPIEQIKEEWESTQELDNLGLPTMDEFTCDPSNKDND